MCEERTERFVVKILPSAELRSRTSDKHEAKKFVKLYNIIMVFPTGIWRGWNCWVIAATVSLLFLQFLDMFLCWLSYHRNLEPETTPWNWRGQTPQNYTTAECSTDELNAPRQSCWRSWRKITRNVPILTVKWTVWAYVTRKSSKMISSTTCQCMRWR